MGLGSSIFLIAAGAILHFAVTAHVKDINIQRVGTILMVVGIAGLLISVASMTFLARHHRSRTADRTRDPRQPPY